MQHKETKQIEQLYDPSWTAVFMLIGFSMIFIARMLRPLPADAHPIIVFIVGVMPNFGAGLAIPFFILVLNDAFFKKQLWQPAMQFNVICLFTLLGLAAWELAHTLAWGVPFDWFDMLATIAGIACAYIAFHTLIFCKNQF